MRTHQHRRLWRCCRRNWLGEKTNKLFQFTSSAQSESLALRLAGADLGEDGTLLDGNPQVSLKWFKSG